MVKEAVSCEVCGADVWRERGEINRNRRLGRRFFCSLSCTAKAANAPRRCKEVVRTCPRCKKRFTTTTHNKAKKFCSRKCANARHFPVTEAMREAGRKSGLAHRGNLLPVEEVLRRREAWKYAALKEYLVSRPHQFEFSVGGFVFDLSLLDVKILVEFDGPYHRQQRKRDEEKDNAAAAAGYVVVRRPVLPASVISPETIDGL